MKAMNKTRLIKNYNLFSLECINMMTLSTFLSRFNKGVTGISPSRSNNSDVSIKISPPLTLCSYIKITAKRAFKENHQNRLSISALKTYKEIK